MAGAWVVGFGLMAAGVFGAEANLVKNGDFEKGRPGGGGPEGWELLQTGREWVDVGGEHGHIIRVTVPRDIARTEGYKYFSEKFPIQEGRTYRCTLAIRSFGPSVVVFLDGITQFGGQERVIYRKQIKSDKRVQNKEWSTLDFEFTPSQMSAVSSKVLERRKREQPHVEQLRIEFFVYGGDAGVVEFDDVKIVPQGAAPSTQPAGRRETPNAERGTPGDAR